MQVVNPVLIIILVPIYDLIVYPLCAKIPLFKRLLQRMVAGYILVIISFLVAALLEYEMQKASEALNRPNQVRVLNLMPCDMSVYDEFEMQKYADISKSIYSDNKVINLPRNLIDAISKSI